jgi:hypothetical protein
MAQNSSTEKLTIKQQALLALMLTGKSVEQAAREGNVAERTAYRWVKEPAFKEALIAGQKQVFETALRALLLKVQKAINTLDRCMDDGLTNPTSVQVRAAQITLEQALTVHKNAELEERIAELEKLVRQPRGTDWRVIS